MDKNETPRYDLIMGTWDYKTGFPRLYKREELVLKRGKYKPLVAKELKNWVKSLEIGFKRKESSEK